MLRTLKLTIAYDGTNYAGWQRQANAISIQQVLEDEIDAIVGAHHPLNAAGRTDAGVHAAAQVASITIDHPIATGELLRALNARLKAGDIRVRSIEEMPDRWDARIFAKGKTYRYAIWNGAPPSPFWRHVVWHVPHRLDIDRMQRAAHALIGEHDFAAFRAAGCTAKTTTRRVDSIALTRSAPYLLDIDIRGNAFLRQMVRILVGTLTEVGTGRRSAAQVPEILASKDRTRAGITAPAHGLELIEVRYDGVRVPRV